jgi:hypothetical protein
MQNGFIFGCLYEQDLRVPIDCHFRRQAFLDAGSCSRRC